MATETRGESLSGQRTALFSIGIEKRIGLQLQAKVEFDVAFRERGHHRVAQIVVGRAEGQPRYRRSLVVDFGHTEYCIAWPSPSRYGTQLK